MILNFTDISLAKEALLETNKGATSAFKFHELLRLMVETDAFEVSVTPIKQPHSEEELERLQKKIDYLKEELDFVTGETNE